MRYFQYVTIKHVSTTSDWIPILMFDIKVLSQGCYLPCLCEHLKSSPRSYRACAVCGRGVWARASKEPSPQSRLIWSHQQTTAALSCRECGWDCNKNDTTVEIFVCIVLSKTKKTWVKKKMWQHNELLNVLQVVGVCCLLRTSLFEEVFYFSILREWLRQ